MYTSTIIIASAFVFIVLCWLAVYFFMGKDFITLFLAILFGIFGTMITYCDYKDNEKRAEHPYDKTYTIKLYYIDGGNTVNKYTCDGWETPHMQNNHGTYIFRLGDYTIPCVTRYEIINIEKHNYK